MNPIKTFAAIVTFAAATTLPAQNVDQHLKTFGYMMFERSGLSELKLTQTEFDSFVAGMRDALSGVELPKDMQQKAAQTMEYLRNRAEANMKIAAEKAEAEAKEFWKKLEAEKDVQKMPSGLAFKITKQGEGELPKENSIVEVKYTGKLIDGKVFDTSGDRAVQMGLDRVIEGFREGLQKIGMGGKITLYIPAKLGYGNNALPQIPPNSTLIFDVEMVKVMPPKAEPQMPQSADPKPAEPTNLPK